MDKKFKIGQTIGAISQGLGLTEATIIRTDDKFYYCRIINGTANIPIVSQDNYKVVKPSPLLLSQKL